MNLDPQDRTEASPSVGGPSSVHSTATVAADVEDFGPSAGRALISVEEYLRMGAAGVWEPGRRIELIEGEIVDVAPMEPPHWQSLRKLLIWTHKNLPEGQEHYCHLPVVLPGQTSVPEPDLAWGMPFPDETRRAEGADVVLIVEVSDSSRRRDLVQKRRVYAGAGVPDYWVVDLIRRQIVVHRSPDGGDYRAVTLHGDGETVAPLCAPGATLTVDAVLPPPAGESAGGPSP